MVSTAKLPWRQRSSWPLIIGTVSLTLITCFLFTCYGRIHWDITWTAMLLKHDIEEIRTAAENRKVTGLSQDTKTLLDDVDKKINRIKRAGTFLMSATSLFPITGLTALGFSIAAFFRKPHWAAWIALPFGLLGAFMALIIT